MQSLSVLLERLAQAGIQISAEGERLVVQGKPSALDAGLRHELQTKKNELLLWLRQQQTATTPDAPVRYPLNAEQTRLWFMDKLSQNSQGFVLHASLTLRGTIDPEVWKHAVAQAVSRHQILAARLHEDDTQAWLSVSEQRPELELCSAEAPHTLPPGTLFRVLLQPHADHYRLTFLLHHIIADRTSMAVLINDCFMAAQGTPLPEAAQFTERLLDVAGHNSNTPEALAWWRTTLEDAPAEVALPFDRPRPAERGQQGAMISLPLPADADLSHLSKTLAATPFMIYLAIYAQLLQRWSGDEDMVIGCPVSTRKTLKDQSMVGFLVNTLPLRLQSGRNDDLSARVNQVKASLLNALSQPTVTLDQIVNTLKPRRHLNRNPLFQVMFVLQAQPLTLPDMPGIEVEALPIAPLAPEVDLNLNLERTTDPDFPYIAHLEYDPDLFDERTAQAFLRQFIDLCIAAAQPNHSASLTRNTQDLACLRGPTAELPQHSIDTLILETLQRGQTPVLNRGLTPVLAPVLTAQVASITQALRSRGVGEGVCIGLCLPGLTELVPALLGIWQTGACAVFLPTDGPVNAIVERAHRVGTRHIIVGNGSPDLHGLQNNVSGLQPDLLLNWPSLLEDAVSPLPSTRTAATHALPPSQRPAYVCFTSGSTGEPKPVFISHASLLNHALDVSRRFELSPNDTVLQFAASAFDVLLEEVIPALLSGARVVQLTPDQTRDLTAFEQALHEHRITVANLPAAFWHTWVNERSQTHTPLPDTLRLMVTGSEAVRATAARQWQQQAPHCRLISAYGLTETTISASMLAVDDIPDHWSNLPLGEPLQNTELAVVGDDNQPLPPLCLGEIRVRGQALMLSSNRDAQPVTPGDPVSELHTGDRGRMDLDGHLWCLGRGDRQVKIRGIRVEPASLERALSQHPGLSEVAAVTVPIAHRQSLWAFVSGPAANNLEAIKAHLHRVVPDVLIPDHIIALPVLPRTSQGKIDYKALIQQAGQHQTPATRNDSGTAREQLIARVFSEVLQRTPIHPDDNFFDLGGDSITSLQVISRARRAGLELTAKIIFEHQTVRAIAQQTTPVTNPADPAEATGPLWTTPILSWFTGEMKGTWQQFNQAVVIALPEPVDLPRLERALNAVIQCHEIFGIQVVPESTGKIRFQIPANRPAPLFTHVERPSGITDAAWSEIRQAHLTKAQTQLDPLRSINVAAVALPSDGQMMLTVHHLCIDVLSWQVVLRDLQLAYESQDATGAAPPLKRHGLPWRQWSLALQAFSQTPEVKAALPFWIDSLSARPTPLAPSLLPLPGLETEASSLRKALPASLTRHLLRKVPAQWGLRMDETLLTALGLAHAARQGTVLRVDLERNGRASPLDSLDISETVGWFTSVLPLSIMTVNAPQRMAQDIKAALSRMPLDGLSYGLLRFGDDPDAVRQLADLPAADALVNYVGVLDGWTEAPFQPVDADTGPTIAADLARSHRIELNAGVVAGELRLAINYAAGPGSEAAATTLMNDIADALERIATETGYQTDAVDHDDETRAQNPLTILPVTPLQHSILLHSLHDPQTYFDQLRFELQGPLDIAALQSAWGLLLKRHAALRSGFGFNEADEPCQILTDDAVLSWQIHDWTDHLQPEAEQHLHALMQADRQKGFILEQPPLMRMHLVKRSPDLYDWIWSSHHLILDGWSVSILMQELLTAYTACLHNTSPDWPAAPDWHAFVTRWHQLNADAARQWWKKTLADVTPTLMTPETPSEPGITRNKAQHTASLAMTPDLRDALTAACRQHSVPLGVLIQASWGLLLRRYRSVESVVFGITFAHRPLDFDNADALVGMTINTVPVVAHLHPQMPLAELLNQLKQQSFEREAHAFIGLDDIMQAARHQPDSPLFDTLLLVQNYPRPSHLTTGGLTLHVRDVQEQTNFALTAIMTTGDDATLGLAWDASRIPDALGEALLAHWHALLQGMTRSTAHAIADVSIYSAATLADRIALATGPDSGLAAPNVLDRFNDWVQILPDHPAIEAQEGCFSYLALSQAADEIARSLINLDVTPGTPVAILLPRGARAIAAFMGSLKTGAMALPVDAGYPADRIAYMLKDSQAKWVITTSALSDKLAGHEGLRILHVDHMPAPIAVQGLARPVPRPDDPAYLIYTSGSTGQPKGAITHHGGLANMMRVQQHHITPSAGDKVLQFAALSFDASIWEIFMALGAGATLHIPDPEKVRFGEELLDTLEHARITIATLPPSLMVALPWRNLPALHTLIVAGEACPDAVIEKWSTGRRFFNGYGPTEASVCSNLYEVPNRKKQVPIGKPAAHIKTYVVDPDGQLVPPGGEGELVIGGAGVGLGYLHRPELTQSRFKPDPWSTTAGGRIYYSGDRVRVGEQGELIFCGRIDRQLKVRGFRVEPGEVERHLEQTAPIEKALVGLSARDQDEAVLLAWVLPRPGSLINPQQLRETLMRQLPAHMVPGVIQVISHIPLTPNAKIDWTALPLPEATAAAQTTTAPAPTVPKAALAKDRFTAIAQALEPIWAGLLKLPKVEWHRNFFDLGGQSLLLVKMQPMLHETFQIKVPTRILFEQATIAALAQWLDEHHAVIDIPEEASVTQHTNENAPPDKRAPETASAGAIAIIGMACRFPGADSVSAFWDLLREGREGITDFSGDISGGSTAADQGHFVARRGVIENADHFDASFFGIGPRDALLLDPQHRLFLESVWNAFEDAAEIPGGNVGVFAGCSHNTWLREVLVPAGENINGSAGFHAITANDKDFLATQVAYRLNLEGPAVTVQSACSTSLIAVAQAVDALRAGRCDMALAGGVSLSFPESTGYAYEPGMILSPDGHCRPFAADAAGTIPGAGVGVVLLKPLEKALQDGNRIYATIRGTGVSNDGARKMSFAAPGIDGQAKAIQEALNNAGLHGEDIDFIEAHGTGTALGDPVEITALGRAYAKPGRQPLLIGSVKSNIGHADAAAGVAGLIKTALSLHHQFLPASLHAHRLNPKLDPGSQPWFEVAREGVTLKPATRPLRGGVSSFGIGGTNAHIVLEQAPMRAIQRHTTDHWQIFPVSAATPAQLSTVSAALLRHLQYRHDDLSDIATTLQQGRTGLKARKAFVARQRDALQSALSHAASSMQPAEPQSGRRAQKIALLFPGQGVQHPGMGHDLLTGYPAFKAQLAELSDVLRPILGLSLMDALTDAGRDAAFWQDTRIAQPAILALSLACAQWWAALGIKADMMLGHSLGEYTAACLAGVFSPEEALTIVAERARLMATMPEGAMMAVSTDESTLQLLLAQHPELDLAAINGPRNVVVSGPADALDRLAATLAGQSIPAQRLRTSHAFHSRAMAPAAHSLAAFLRTRTLNRPNRKFVSNLTGTWITPEQAVSPDYWAEHMLAPVRFGQGLETLQEKGVGMVIEAGPGQVLSTLARGRGMSTFPSMDAASAQHSAQAHDRAPACVDSVARLWEAGQDINWQVFNPRSGQRIALPGYPWARQRFRPTATTTVTATAPVPSTHTEVKTTSTTPSDAGKPSPDHWFFAPRWVRQPLPAAETPANAPIALYSDTLAIANPVAQVLRESGYRVQVVTSVASLMALPESARTHLLILATAHDEGSAQTRMSHICTSLLALRDALLACRPQSATVDLVTIGGATVQGHEAVDPVNTALIAACRVMAGEFPEHAFAGLDLATAEPLTIARSLKTWLERQRKNHFLALRQGLYWQEDVVASPMPAAAPWPLAEGATVLITGAAGGVGHAFARDLARHAKAPHLLLTTHRSPLPPELISDLEALGARVSSIRLDLTQEHATTQALLEWQNTFGPIHGVIHAAGLADYGGIMARRDAESIETILAPKVAGLHGIENALTGLPLDFLVLCSTLGSYLPAAKFGQAAYSAANAYLDGAAAALSQRQPWRVLTVNWDDWTEAGMTVAARTRAGLPPLAADSGLLAHEGPLALRRVLPTSLNRVAISVHDLPALMARTGPWLLEERVQASRPAETDTPSVLQRLFCDVLNVPACTPDDDFFDLGGHSLLAMQLISGIKETLGQDIALIDLFEAPTPGALAQLLAKKLSRTP